MKSWLTRIICLATIIWLGSVYHQTTIDSMSRPYTTDFFKFYLTGLRINQGQPAYWDVPPKMNSSDACHPKNIDGAHRETPRSLKPGQNPLPTGCLNPNLNTPIWGGLFAELAKLPFSWALAIWQTTSVACLLISVFMIARCRKPEQAGLTMPDYVLILFTASLAFYPTYVAHWGGQVSLLLTPLVVGAWLALRQNRTTLAGAILGALTVLKPFFGIFFVTLFLGRRGTAIKSMASSSAFFGSISIMWWGVDTHLHYLNALRNVTWTSSNWNGSITGFFTRLLGGAEGLSLYSEPVIAKAMIAISSCGLMLWAAFHIRNTKKKPPQSSDNLFGITLIIMLLISPLGWLYYFPWLLIPALVLWHSNDKSKKLQPHHALTLTFLAITCIPRDLVGPFSMRTATDLIWHGAVYTYALTALAAAMHISNLNEPGN